jgi:hypothetical protein
MFICSQHQLDGGEELSMRVPHLRRDTNNTASRARTCVTRLLGLGVVRLAEVVGAGVDDDGALLSTSAKLLELSSHPRHILLSSSHSKCRG